MTDYTKLVEALRCCAGTNTKPTKCPDYDDSWCDGNCLDKHLIAAADAIEALQAELGKEGKRVEHLLAMVNELEDKMPELGEWELIDGAEPMRWGCSLCKYLSWETSTYCPRCGAKMEVQDGQ